LACTELTACFTQSREERKEDASRNIPFGICLLSAKIVRVKVSAVIIAFNEEAKIAAAIESVSWADEVVLVDSASTDRTREIAESMGARVISRDWTGFSDQKQFGADSAANDWIFSLDADEVASPELIVEVAALSQAADEPAAAAYRIPRLAFYHGKPIRHGGWYPDRQIRLFDRRRGRWSDTLVHESFHPEEGASVGSLRGDIYHYSVEDSLHHHRMIGERYAPLAARQRFADGHRTSRFAVALAGPVAFFSTYVLKAGFLDGFAGYAIARFAAQNAFLKHLYLWELQSGLADTSR